VQVVECESLESEIRAGETAIFKSPSPAWAVLWVDALRIELSDWPALEAAMKLARELA
jgi:hypothetical protein